jgi:uncharacterized repeat protein (TIGR03803 family)
MNSKTLLSTILLMAFATTSFAHSQTYSQLHVFHLGKNGYRPLEVVASKAGEIFGETFYGGGSTLCGTNGFGQPAGCGTIFEMHADGTRYTQLYSFSGYPDGATPSGTLIFDKNGNLYGVTAGGGANGKGTVFELSPPSAPGGPWTETTLYDFTSFDEGFRYSGLAVDGAGNLYVTDPGYPDTFGNIFELTPPTNPGDPWTYQLLYTFAGLQKFDGTLPTGALAIDSHGNIYGTTQWGGINNCYSVGCGTIYQLRPPKNPGDPWTQRVLYRFNGATDGYQPFGGIVLHEGMLYGTAGFGGDLGGGTVFQFSMSGGSPNFVLLHSCGNDGQNPATIAFDAAGNLYSATSFLFGTVFMLTPSNGGNWPETIVHTFQSGGDGYSPIGNLASVPSGVVGATEGGETNQDQGTIYLVGP